MTPLYWIEITALLSIGRDISEPDDQEGMTVAIAAIIHNDSPVKRAMATWERRLSIGRNAKKRREYADTTRE